MIPRYPVVVLGAGQAGLAMGYYLKSAGIAYVIIGKETRIGDVWRNRYDSLVLFTPRWMSHLPGYVEHGKTNPDGYADKDEVADELAAYAADHQLNVQLNTTVSGITRTGEGYNVETNQGKLAASCVVIATGPFQQPYVPDFAQGLSPEVYQAHTANYKNREQLREGNVLIVGSGNSGAQIAVELAKTHQVHVSAGKAIQFAPQTILGKSLFWWFKKIGLYKMNLDTRIGRRLSKRGDPVIGTALKDLMRSGAVALHPRTLEASGDRVTFVDRTQLGISNVIWATGYTKDYGWLQGIPQALDDQGNPSHIRGISKADGVYFLGLPWQYYRGSSLIGGVAADAKYLLQDIARFLSKGT